MEPNTTDWGRLLLETVHVNRFGMAENRHSSYRRSAPLIRE